MKYSLISLSIMLLLLLALPDTAAAEYLRGATADVARHDKRTTRHMLQSQQTKSQLAIWGILFEPNLWKGDEASSARLISFNELPACGSGRTKMLELTAHSVLADGIDIVYYAPADSSQRQKAAQSSLNAVPYFPALLQDKETMVADPLQEFARFLRIQCLPTRFRFISADSKRFAEYREGGDAWKAP